MGIGFSTWLESQVWTERFPGKFWALSQLGISACACATRWIGNSLRWHFTAWSGHQTIFSQIAAELLGMDFDQILVRHGDTETVQQGVGTFGSRAVPTAGEAVKNACLQVNEKAKLIAAHLLECHPNDVINIEGGFQVKGVPGARVDWSDVAMSSYQPLALPKISRSDRWRLNTIKRYLDSYPSGLMPA